MKHTRLQQVGWSVTLALLVISVGLACAEAIGARSLSVDNRSSSLAAPAATPLPPPPGGGMTLKQTLSDEAQRNTIAFDGLAFLTGNLGADSFFPPGKVADFWGFQYLRDNDPSGMGHNTDFLTRASFNMLHVLTAGQRAELTALAESQVDAISQYASTRFVLMDAFRRLLEGDVPAGSSGLDRDAVRVYSAELYRLDGEISYERAQVMGGILSGLTADQKAYLDAMVGQGMLAWPDVKEPEDLRGLDRRVKEAVMTYAGDMFSWYAGSIEADVYFCPERQGTYFGSFYMKDAPAVGNPGYSIPVTMTAEMGETFLTLLTTDQRTAVTGLVEDQKPALYAIVDRREEVAAQLRRFIAGETPDQAQVLALMDAYGELDGEIVYRYATVFAQVNQSLTEAQRAQLAALRTRILGNLALPQGAFLYAQPIAMPVIPSSDFLFANNATGGPTATPTAPGSATFTPTPASTAVPTATPTRRPPPPPPTGTPTRLPPSPTPTRPPSAAIANVSPHSAVQGQRGLLVTVTLAAAPPPSAPPEVRIGALIGRNVSRNGPEVQAVFDIPPAEPMGWKDVSVSFPAPGATATFTKASGFEVRSGGIQPPPPQRTALPLVLN